MIGMGEMIYLISLILKWVKVIEPEQSDMISIVGCILVVIGALIIFSKWLISGIKDIKEELQGDPIFNTKSSVKKTSKKRKQKRIHRCTFYAKHRCSLVGDESEKKQARTLRKD